MDAAAVVLRFDYRSDRLCAAVPDLSAWDRDAAADDGDGVGSDGEVGDVIRVP